MLDKDIETQLIENYGTPYVSMKNPDSAYVITLHKKEQLVNLVDNLLHLKWLWDLKYPDPKPLLARPAMLEDDEQDVNDFHSDKEVN